jgi:maltooligosyltrehalose trehalohydrolase
VESPRWALPLGANANADGVRFGVWAPKARTVEVEVARSDGSDHDFWPLARDEHGIFRGLVLELRAGALYRYRLDGGPSYPDPWSRSQPAGVHGPSKVVDPLAFRWNDDRWTGVSRAGLAVYELHVGTFSRSGTFDAVISELAYLQRLGISAIELMPVAEFPGSRNWGYDGVDLFAPSRVYGGPTGMKRLIDAAHRRGLGVILDVVYNHLGPDGNYLRAYSDAYFTDRHRTPWGDAVNLDGPDAERVREIFLQNACYWLVEYHLDGLRLDATHALVDASQPHLLAEIGERARDAVGPNRRLVITAEDDRRGIWIARPERQGGYGLDAVWADDFHHAVHVLLTDQQEGYYQAYAGTIGEVARAIATGVVYQGELSTYDLQPRGTPVLDDPSEAFIFCLQNHDQIGNRAFGERLEQLVGRRRYLVAVTLLLFAPETPLLFMGQEFAASSPFLYFTDHEPALGKLVTEGRRGEFARFAAFQDPAGRDQIPDPQAPETFERSRLRWEERQPNSGVVRLHQDLLRLRRTDTVLQRADRLRTAALPIGGSVLAVRRWDDSGERLLLANVGEALAIDLNDLWLAPAARPGHWRCLVSTARRRYSGEPRARVHRLDVGRVVVPTETALILARDS